MFCLFLYINNQLISGFSILLKTLWYWYKDTHSQK